MLFNIPQCTGQFPTAKNYPAQHASRAKAEKPCYSRWLWTLLKHLLVTRMFYSTFQEHDKGICLLTLSVNATFCLGKHHHVIFRHFISLVPFLHWLRTESMLAQASLSYSLPLHLTFVLVLFLRTIFHSSKDI